MHISDIFRIIRPARRREGEGEGDQKSYYFLSELYVKVESTDGSLVGLFDKNKEFHFSFSRAGARLVHPAPPPVPVYSAEF